MAQLAYPEKREHRSWFWRLVGVAAIALFLAYSVFVTYLGYVAIFHSR